MPRGDRTGPSGRGSKTGRGLGYCTGYSSPGYTKGRPRGGGGFGHGARRGSGFRSLNSAPGPAPIYPGGTQVSGQERPAEQTQRRQTNPGVSGSNQNDPETQNLRRKAEMLEKELEKIYREMEELKQNK